MSLLEVNYTDAVIPRGTNKSIRLQIFNEDDESFDLSGYSDGVTLRVSYSWADSYAILEKEAVIVNAPEGRIRFDFIPEDTENLPCRSYYFTVFAVAEETGEKQPAYRGTIGVTPVAPEMEG